MKFVHAAIRVTSRENAKRFYADLLTLPLLREYEVKASLAKKLFDISEPYEIQLYDFGNATLEVFIGGEPKFQKTVNHLCIEVEDREKLLKRTREMGFTVKAIPREGRPDLVFIHDTDGNSFEVK